MAGLKNFLKDNKKTKGNTTFPATKSLLDENGEPVLWTVRPIGTREYERITDDCTIEVPAKGNQGVYRNKLNGTKFIRRLAIAATVEPDLYNAELQDSYGVKNEEDLLLELLDDPDEYNAYVSFIQSYSGYESIDEKVKKAKN